MNAHNQICNYIEQGKMHEASQLIYNSLDTGQRPAWAVNALLTAVEHKNPNVKSINAAIEMAKDPNRWHEAHQIFDGLRDDLIATLNSSQRYEKHDTLLQYLSLAELVSKVIYNATEPDDPFDEDSGEAIPMCIKQLLDYFQDAQFSQKMWSVLLGPIKEEP